jgi:hypothetical protein
MSSDKINEAFKGEHTVAAVAIARLVLSIADNPQVPQFVVFRTLGTESRRGQVRVRPHDKLPRRAHEVIGVYTREVTMAQLVADLSGLEGSQ